MRAKNSANALATYTQRHCVVCEWFKDKRMSNAIEKKMDPLSMQVVRLTLRKLRRLSPDFWGNIVCDSRHRSALARSPFVLD
jgi:hypothetical protein